MGRISEYEIKQIIDRLETEVENRKNIPALASRIELAREIIEMLQNAFVKTTPRKKVK